MTDGAIQSNFYQRLGVLLVKQRKAKKFRQLRLAAAIGVHRNTLMRWEKGTAAIDVRSLLAIGEILDCDFSGLFARDEKVWLM